MAGSKGHTLPYRLFSKDQRVIHTAVVENKRLSHALTIINAQQDVKREPKVQTNSEKGGYKKNPRQLHGPNYKPKSVAAPAVEMTTTIWFRHFYFVAGETNQLCSNMTIIRRFDLSVAHQRRPLDFLKDRLCRQHGLLLT